MKNATSILIGLFTIFALASSATAIEKPCYGYVTSCALDEEPVTTHYVSPVFRYTMSFAACQSEAQLALGFDHRSEAAEDRRSTMAHLGADLWTIRHFFFSYGNLLDDGAFFADEARLASRDDD